MTLKCVDARHLVHLAVGDDTLSDEEQQLADHLHACSDCRAYHAGMMDAMHALERVRDEDYAEPPPKSIWPGLADQLKARQVVVAGPEPRRFNVAVATLCACSLVLALVTAVQNLPSNNVNQLTSQQMLPAMNVRLQPGQFQNNANQPQQQWGELHLKDDSVLIFNPVTRQLYTPSIVASNDEDMNF